MEEKKFLLASLLASFILIFGAVLFLSGASGGGARKVNDPSVLVREDSHSRGDVNSKVTVVEFSDFQCPACGTAKREMDKVLKEYGNKIRFVYRHCPLVQIHRFAQGASEASEFASSYGKFWEWYDLMFDKQSEWSANNVDEKKFEDLIVSYAKSMGLDEGKLLSDLHNGVYKERVNKDILDGNVLSLSGTPTFFVNGEEVASYRFEDLKSAIEKNLK